MKIRGIVQGAFGARDAVFLSRKFLAAEAGLSDQSDFLAVYLHDPDLAPLVRDRVMADFPAVEARTWHEDSSYLRSNLGAIDAITAVSVAMIIAAVSIPILALLYINVLYRRRDVGLMVAVGLGRAEVFICHLLQAVAVAHVGMDFGWVLGGGLILWFDAHPVFAWDGFVILPAPSLIAFVRPSLIVLATSTVAGALPAWLASRIDPARVLRGTG
jgi:lipoprotein-releasing system permease protein